MSLVGPLLVRGVAGGAFVVLFAVIGALLEPKPFAGLFGAAPSVATASLLVTLATKNAHTAQAGAVGMLVGCAALLAYCLAVNGLLGPVRALASSTVSFVAWFAVAGLGWALLLR